MLRALAVRTLQRKRRGELWVVARQMMSSDTNPVTSDGILLVQTFISKQSVAFSDFRQAWKELTFPLVYWWVVGGAIGDPAGLFLLCGVGLWTYTYLSTVWARSWYRCWTQNWNIIHRFTVQAVSDGTFNTICIRHGTSVLYLWFNTICMPYGICTNPNCINHCIAYGW